MNERVERLELELRDGTPVIVRRLLPGDRELVADAYRRASPETRYQRFWSATGETIGGRMLDRMLDENPTAHASWVVLDPSRACPGVGGASWWRRASNPDEAEISAIVLDQDQRRGIGTLLLAVLWLTALRERIQFFDGYTLASNRQAADWMRDCGGVGNWDTHKLIFRWNLLDRDDLPETDAGRELSARLSELAPVLHRQS